jgi:hypothetical protein
MLKAGMKASFVTTTLTDFEEVRLKLFLSWRMKV